MEYNLQDIDKAIFYYLSLYKDQPKSISQIFTGLETDDIVLEFKNRNEHNLNVIKLKTSCHIMNDKFKPIHKIFIKGVLHLVYTDNINDIDRTLDNISDLETDFDFKEIVKDITLNPLNYPHININNTIDEMDTPLHICCQIEDSNYLEKLLDYYDIDTNIKNASNQKAIDIAISNNFSNHVNLINTYHYNKIITNLKNINQKVQAEHNLQTEQTTYLRNQMDILSDHLISLWSLMIVLYNIVKFVIINKSFDFINNDINENTLYTIASFITLQLFFNKNVFSLFSIKHYIILGLTYMLCYYEWFINNEYIINKLEL